MKNCAAIIIAAVLFNAITLKAGDALDVNTIYDSDTNHLWNRLNETLFDRSGPDGKHYGFDELDILYWNTTTNLLGGVSHQQATNVLDEFINTHGERLIQDPLKKALLQRDLWALFDWTAGGRKSNHQVEQKKLLKRLAVAIQCLELTTNEIASLPNNYALAEKNNLADLPQGLFQTNGDWINVSVNNAERLVPMHDLGFGGRSVFMVLFHDADGRKAGTNYLKQISSIKPMWIPSTNPNFPNEMQLNAGFPQFPTNSQWALARRMCVIDTDGRIQPTHVVESIQLRTYLGFGEPDFVIITNRNGYVVDEPVPPQRFNEFRMTRHDAKLVSLAKDKKDFSGNNHFFSMGADAFEPGRWDTNYTTWATNYDSLRWQGIVLQNCYQCHGGSGIYSVNSFTRVLSGERPAETTQMVESDGKREEEMTPLFKVSQANWGLLQGLWNQEN
jgi:hypothetical protein